MIELTDVIAAPTELDWGRFVNPVQGGKTIATAITIEDGAYTFKQHMDKGEKQYFFIPLTEAQRLRMIVTAQGRLVSYDKNGELVEKKGFDFSNFWADFVTADDEPIKGPFRRVQFRSRAPGFQKEAQMMSRGPDGVYFRVTANSMKINKDTRFDLFIDEAGDMITGRDAPAEAGPDLLAVKPLQDVVGHIGLQDAVDSYEIVGLSEDTQELALVINFTDPDFKYRVLITNLDTDRRIKRFNGLNGRQSLFFDIPKERPDLMIQIINQVAGSKKFSSYTFVLED
ncbi:MAG: hypothetical protein JKY60_06575 [Kordiimonadaceae bacterium]|nr:hypothetical protein [Kordiimonadaceae bacterium]